MWFIDKLNMHQEHPFPLPIVGTEMVLKVDIQTGEKICETPNGRILEGSYSSKITIRCNGTRVQVQGNPSRWHRSDNLFGFTSIDDCVRVYNSILRSLELPPFSKCKNIHFLQGKESERAKCVSDGAMIDHIDFTRNLTVGKGNELAFLRGLSGQQIGKGKEPYLYANGQTVDWYKGSTLLYKKVYRKAFDLEKHAKKRLKEAGEGHSQYYQKLIDWCNEVGVLREEHSFKRAWLRKKNLCFYGHSEEREFLQYLCDIKNVIGRLTVMKTNYETIADQLLDSGVVASRQAANTTQSVAFQWLHGCTLERKSQFYVHRSRLLKIGIDISIPYDVVRLPPQVRSSKLIDVEPVAPPSWYKMPQPVSSLSLVG